ncbi:MAG TPA: hypothetical protein VE129_16710 [Thermoanaerobaculia bacterium]|nr:hypothetical protein [Thermoanaerobaculia bacterium]
MRNPRGALLATVLLMASVANAQEPEREVFFVTLLKTAAYGLSEFEAAAWLVRLDGRETLVPWPPARLRRTHSWHLALPHGTVALLHVHPATGTERPSVHDRAVARRLRLPVYTISRWAIYRADPDGTVSTVGSPCWTPTIDWELAEGLLASGSDNLLVAEGSSGGTTPGVEAAVR